MTAEWTQRRVGMAADADGPGFTVWERDSGTPGPTVVVLGGVHGNEVGAIVAAGRLTQSQLPLRSGKLLVAPVTHESAYAADSRVGPADGLNLARVFPGRPDGTPTERLAHLVTEQLLRHADVLVDLHTSSPETDMPLFAGCLDDGSAAATRAVELTVAFCTPVLWTHARLGPGRSLTAAHQFGIPAIYVESPVGGVLDVVHLEAYESGLHRVLEALGMMADAPPGRPSRLWLHGDGDVDAFSQVKVDGLFRAETALLDRVEKGQVVGTVVDTRGQLLEEVRAGDTGHVATLRRIAHVRPGMPVAGIVPARPAKLGLPSDSLHTTSGDPR